MLCQLSHRPNKMPENSTSKFVGWSTSSRELCCLKGSPLPGRSGDRLAGMTGFEPAFSCSTNRRLTSRLHMPMKKGPSGKTFRSLSFKTSHPYSTTSSISASALPPVSMAANTSNTLSDQPPIRKTSFRSTFSGD
jgi:hypothetical protein